MGYSYADVMMMPTSSRRYFLGLLTRDTEQRNQQMEEQRAKYEKRNSKGSKTTTVSGDALKAKIKSGEIPTDK